MSFTERQGRGGGGGVNVRIDACLLLWPVLWKKLHTADSIS